MGYWADRGCHHETGNVRVCQADHPRRGVIVQDPRALRYLVDVVGSGRVMLGSDMPFPIGDPAPLKIVEATALSGAERAAIHRGTAQRLFEL